MARKVLTGAAHPVALGYQVGDEWIPLTGANIGGGTYALSTVMYYINDAGDAVAWPQGSEGGPGIEILPIVEKTECGTAAISGDNTLVLAPGAGKRIVVSAFMMQNGSAVATTAILRSASTSNGWRMLGQNQGDGLAMSFANGREWRLNENEALVLNLSGANTHNYSIHWWVEYV
jgi:hypothetical protein